MSEPIYQLDELPQDLGAVTNKSFLCSVFTDLGPEERPMVLCIPGAIDKSTPWGKGNSWAPQALTPLDEVQDEEANWFFTLSTYLPKNGLYRRIKAQFHRAHGVMLDDIGSKSEPRSRLDACPPSYVIETSPGNYQAGYLFVEPEADLAKVNALQEALVATGLCDAGAKAPATRLGRLPKGFNGKYDDFPQCRLVEWHPERRYTVEQITEQLQLVEPKKRSPRSTGAISVDPSGKEVYVPRASENAVIVALRDRGLYKRPLDEGKHDITCPWVDEHTDALDSGTAYFEPSLEYLLGGFKCMHSHGDRLKIRDLLSVLGLDLSAARQKPTIRMAPGNLDQIVDAAEHALASYGSYYQFGGFIVRVIKEADSGNDVIKPISANTLTRALSICASWERFNSTLQCFVVSDPVGRYVNVLFEAEQYAHLPLLRGLSRQPFLRTDGSLVQTSGYDPKSGFYGVFDPLGYSIPERPSITEARAALAQLLQLLAEFSFAKEHDRSAAIAGILTAAIRPTLPLAPMFHIKAPQIASGKSYLSSLLAAFAGPHAPSVYTFPSNDEECTKLLLSALLTAPAVVTFDNLTTDLLPYKSLCSSLTEEHLTGRILGVSKTATVSTRTLFVSSGNNVAPVGDMTRRAVTISLDPACETPATRNFTADPVALVQSQRARYVSYALTIVQAYLAAECPSQALKPLNSYGQWSKLVRSALVWLGLEDPATALFELMNDDPDTEQLGRILNAWQARFGEKPVTLREARGHPFLSDDGVDLSDLLEEVGEYNGRFSNRRLGRWVARKEGRIVDSKRFVRDANKSGGSERWRVMELVDNSKSATTVEAEEDDYDFLR